MMFFSKTPLLAAIVALSMTMVPVQTTRRLIPMIALPRTILLLQRRVISLKPSLSLSQQGAHQVLIILLAPL